MDLPRVAALCVLVGSCASWLLGAEARAEALPRVAVVVSAPAEIEADLREELTGQRGLPVELQVLEAPNAPPSSVERAGATFADALSRARKRYVSADFEACLAELPDDDALVSALGRGDRTSVARVLVWRSACEAGRGATVEAARSARALAIHGLELPPDVGAIAPDAERLIGDAQREVERAPRATLRVESKPEALTVVLDGRPLGCVTPCVAEVAPGDHVIALSGDGVTPVVSRTLVAARGGSVSLSAEPASPELAREQWALHYGGTTSLDHTASLRLLAVALPARKLVVIAAEPVRGGRLELRGAYALDGALAARAGSDPTSPGDAPDRALALVEDLLVRGNTLEPAKPIWKNVWFWVAVGAVAAGAATATALLLQEPEEKTEIRLTAGGATEP